MQERLVPIDMKLKDIGVHGYANNFWKSMYVHVTRVATKLLFATIKVDSWFVNRLKTIYSPALKMKIKILQPFSTDMICSMWGNALI